MDENKIQKEITDLTNQLRDKKPEVYKLLLENPQTIPNGDQMEMVEALKKYRDNLKELLTKK